MSAIILLLLAASPKPACNASNQGRFWPAAANASPAAARAFYRCGALEMCSATARRYRWMTVSVHVSQAGRKHPAPAPACLVSPAGAD